MYDYSQYFNFKYIEKAKKASVVYLKVLNMKYM